MNYLNLKSNSKLNNNKNVMTKFIDVIESTGHKTDLYGTILVNACIFMISIDKQVLRVVTSDRPTHISCGATLRFNSSEEHCN